MLISGTTMIMVRAFTQLFALALAAAFIPPTILNDIPNIAVPWQFWTNSGFGLTQCINMHIKKQNSHISAQETEVGHMC